MNRKVKARTRCGEYSHLRFCAYNVCSSKSSLNDLSEKQKKNVLFKNHVFSELNKKIVKEKKYHLKRLEYRNKGVTFAPATTDKFFYKPASN